MRTSNNERPRGGAMNARVQVTSERHFNGYGRRIPFGRMYTVTILDATLLARAPFGRTADGEPIPTSQTTTLKGARALVKRATKES